jgi:hypothetical protein
MPSGGGAFFAEEASVLLGFAAGALGSAATGAAAF